METYFNNLTAEEGTREKLIHDLRVLVHDAEDLIKATGKTLPDRSKEQLIAALDRVKATCQRVEKDALSAARATDKVIRTYPYPSIGVAFGLGILAGVLLNRD